MQQAAEDIGGFMFAMNGGNEGLLRAANAVNALGALAGIFAQQQARALLGNKFMTLSRDDIVEVVASDGRKYYYGNGINAALMEGTREKPSFWNVMAGAGQDPNIGALVDVAEIAKRTAAAIGSPEFGIPRIDARYGLTETPFDAARRYTKPLNERFVQLKMPMDQLMMSFGLAAQAMAGVAAGESDVAVDIPLPRVEAVRLYMEAAIPMSKIDPKRIDFA